MSTAIKSCLQLLLAIVLVTSVCSLSAQENKVLLGLDFYTQSEFESLGDIFKWKSEPLQPFVIGTGIKVGIGIDYTLAKDKLILKCIPGYSWFREYSKETLINQVPTLLVYKPRIWSTGIGVDYMFNHWVGVSGQLELNNVSVRSFNKNNILHNKTTNTYLGYGAGIKIGFDGSGLLVVDIMLKRIYEHKFLQIGFHYPIYFKKR